ncbi:hypothetical protein [Burkholderia pyrrocinia]
MSLVEGVMSRALLQPTDKRRVRDLKPRRSWGGPARDERVFHAIPVMRFPGELGSARTLPRRHNLA